MERTSIWRVGMDIHLTQVVPDNGNRRSADGFFGPKSHWWWRFAYPVFISAPLSRASLSQQSRGMTFCKLHTQPSITPSHADSLQPKECLCGSCILYLLVCKTPVCTTKINHEFFQKFSFLSSYLFENQQCQSRSMNPVSIKASIVLKVGRTDVGKSCKVTAAIMGAQLEHFGCDLCLRCDNVS